MKLTSGFHALILLSLVSAAAPLHAAGVDWPRWRGPDANGISKETGWLTQWPAEGPKQLWKASVGIGFSSIAVAGGRVYTMGHREGHDMVWGFDAVTGRQIWKHAYAAPLDDRIYEGGPNATPTVDGGRVFTLGRHGDVFCLDAANGNVVWQKNLMKDFGLSEPGKDWWGFSGSPLVEGEVVVLNAGTFGLALDRKTGREVWSTGKGANGYATPVPLKFRGRNAVAVFSAKTLGIVDSRRGSPLLELPWKTSYDVNAADPIFSGAHVFLSSGYRTGGALYELSGDGAPKEIWKSQEMHNQMNPSVLVGGHLYGISGQERRSGDVRCVEFLTGEVKWKDTGAGMGSLMAADGKLIVLSEKGELMIVEANPAAFKTLARAQVLGGRCWTTPALSHGLIYCRNARGDLVCLDVRGGKK